MFGIFTRTDAQFAKTALWTVVYQPLEPNAAWCMKRAEDTPFFGKGGASPLSVRLYG